MISTAALKPGSIGIGVNKQQAYLNMMQEKGFINTLNLQDGVYGTRTEQAVREWQRYANLPIDGEIGNDSVFKMQEYLNEIAAVNKCLRPIPVDGMYGPRTTTMVQQFQYLYDLNIDGVIGKATWDAIVNERNKL